jgi:hypothetical protein
VFITVWMAATLEQARAQDALDLFRQALAFEREVNHTELDSISSPISLAVSLSAV